MSRPLLLVLMSSCLVACPSEPDPPEEGWEIVHRGLPGALLSVWGTSSTNVWAVGGDSQDGLGPTIIHFDGEAWTRVESGQTQGSLWWVFGFEDGPVFMGGEGGVILRYEAGEFTLMETPGTDTVFGIWGASADDVWAVGGASDSTGGFVWRLSGDTWTPEPSLPAEVSDAGSIWKVFGTNPDDAWLVGSNGVAMHWDGTALTLGDSGVGSSLFTVHASEDRYVAVGGAATGIISEYEAGQWTTVAADPPPPGLSGVALGEDDFGVAVGSFGAVYTRSSAGWAAEDLGFNLGMTLHAAWIDDQGCVWAVGGQVYSPPFNDGLLIHRGPSIPSGGL